MPELPPVTIATCMVHLPCLFVGFLRSRENRTTQENRFEQLEQQHDAP
jgi:hypothetical protein